MISVVLLAFIAAVVATPLVRTCAIEIGAVAKPRADRWHQRPTALLGGVAIVIAIALAVLACEARSRSALGLATATMFALGIYDDRVQLRPRDKLLGQLAVVVAYVVVVKPRVFGNAYVDPILAALFLTFVCNALNLLDHIDGLAAGAAAIGAIGLAHGLSLVGAHESALFACAIAGASLGYFVFNASPASIFMGDGGSLALGFALGALALEQVSHAASVQAKLAPLAFLALPLLDSSLVIVARLSEGRAVSQGGRDHSSHRLVALGLDDRTATMALHAAALTAAASGTFLLHTRLAPGLFVLVSTLGLLLAIGSYLLHARANGNTLSRTGRWLASTPARHVRRLAHDAAIASLAFTGAGLLEAEDQSRPGLVIVAAQTIVLHLVTRNRATWREAGVTEVFRVILAAGFAAAIAACAHGPRFVVTDALLLTALACASLFARRTLDLLVTAAR